MEANISTNFYFNNYTNSMEQELVEDLVIESIKIYGHDLWYIIRTLTAEDSILNEDDLSTFDDAIFIEMYIKNVDGFEGEGDLLSKFGIQIRDSITFTVAMRTFYHEIGRKKNMGRPKEGDLIYLPLNGKVWKIMHVEHESIFYQMGALQTYDLRCELFEYSGERFDTGVTLIDELFDNYDRTANTSISKLISTDPDSDNASLNTEAAEWLDFSENNPFGTDTY